MADSKTSALAAFTDIADADLFYAVDDTTSKKITWAALKAEIVAECVAGKQWLYVPATALVPRATNGAIIATIESTTNKVMSYTLDFDAATIEYAQVSIRMPASWDEGTITAIFEWQTTNTGDVVWGIQAVAISNDDAIDSAFGTAVEVTDSVTAATDIMQTEATSAMTVAGTPAAGDTVVFQVYRKASDGADTLAVDAKLRGVVLFVTTATGVEP